MRLNCEKKMKTPLSLPTDNLHKFRSIFGLVLLLGSLLLAYNATHDTLQKLRFYGFKIKEAEGRLLGVSKEDFDAGNWVDFQKMEINSQVKEFYYYSFRVQLLVTTLMFFSGIHQIFFGFRLWKKNVQDYQDEYLKFEVQKIKLECEKMTEDVS